MINFFLKLLTNPFVLICLSVTSGYFIGKISIKGFSLGISVALFTGLGFSYLSTYIEKNFFSANAITHITENQSLFKGTFTLFLIIFVTAVGLQAAEDAVKVIKKYGVSFVVLGIICTLTGAICVYLISANMGLTNQYQVTGIYTGALTSSPGFAAAIETASNKAKKEASNFEKLSEKKQDYILNSLKIKDKNTKYLTNEERKKYIINSESSIGVAYALSYPIGVLVVILSLNIIPKILKIDMKQEREKLQKEFEEEKKKNHRVPFDLGSFCLVAFIGCVTGSIKLNLSAISLGDISLGLTGGVLFASLILGAVGKLGMFNFKMEIKSLVLIQEVSLAFFLALTGLRYGSVFLETLGNATFIIILISLFTSIISLIVAFIIGHYFMKLNWLILSGAICGAMTSTPGLGTAVDKAKSQAPASGYGATYPSALFGMVIFTIIIQKLPF